jgi:hypothetical protein
MAHKIFLGVHLSEKGEKENSSLESKSALSNLMGIIILVADVA